ncbi:MAG: acyltransferase family protein, partial [Acinetobacter baumannii]
MQLRNDINFLRAIAVILVVLYHFNIQGFSLGFIGVDIFFVISGFLMTKIIIEKLNNNTLSLFQFYKSRAIRLIPALFVICFFVFIIGWFFLFNHEFEILSKHIFSSINFFSNFTYWNESGYFDVAAKDKILLHTWSLSLEWQFYLIYPILLSLAFNYKKSTHDIFHFLIFLIILSLASLFYISTIDPVANFYLLPSRAWEFIAGGVVYIFSKNNRFQNNNLLTLLGYSILLFSILFSFDTLWPSYVTLIPIIATTLIILCQSNYVLYQNKIIKIIGLASYSIYLWHWPIVYTMNKMEDTNNIITCILILSAFIIGIISYKTIEIPLKNYLNKKSNKTIIIYYFLCVGLLSFITFLGCISFFPNNSKQKKVESILAIDYSKTYRRDECLVFPGENFRHCDYGHGDLKFLVVGDSHSNAMLLAINNTISSENIKVKAWSVARCSPIKDLKNIKDPKYVCGQLMDT